MIVPPNSVFTARETHGRVLCSGNRLIAHSQDAGWRSLHAAILEEAPFQAVELPDSPSFADLSFEPPHASDPQN